MKKVLLPLLMFAWLDAFSQNGMWAWMKGNIGINPPAVWGVQGIGAPANTPSGKYSSFHWQDLDGNLWVYSGIGLNPAPPPYDGYNDLWKYDVPSNQWIWMHGDTALNAAPVYGVAGVPAPANTPGLRYLEGLCWTDHAGKFWLHTNVTWKYDPDINQWAFMNGVPSSNSPVYGSKGIPSPNNRPGYIAECNASWVDRSGNLWFYGGYIATLLWKYDITTNEWTWVNGDTATYNDHPVYGVMGVPDILNTPGDRLCYCTWKDTSDNLYLFAGSTNFTDPNPGTYNDVWRYMPSSDEWTWISGDSGLTHPANYGPYCTASPFDYPKSRFENRACAMDSCGNVWMFGGFCSLFSGSGCTDIWVYNTYQNEWTLVDGTPDSTVVPVYGTMGVPSVNNTPGDRYGAISWFDNNGYMWLLGGVISSQGYSNQLWKYIPNSTCVNNANCVNIITNSPQVTLSENPDISLSITESQLILSVGNGFLRDNSTIAIYDLVGQKCLTSIFTKGEKISINISGLTQGVYFVTAEDLVRNRIVRKFFKM